MNIVSIHLLSWAASIGGEHYNAKIRCGEDRVPDIKYKMTKAQAKMFNEKEETHRLYHRYKAGDETTRFWTKEDAVNACVEFAIKKWENIGLILVGDEHNPHEPAWCYSEELKNQLNELWLDAESLYEQTYDPFTKFPKETDEIWGKWRVLIQQIKDK